MKLIYGFAASATLHAAAFSIPGSPAVEWQQKTIPVVLVVESPAPDGSHSLQPKPRPDPAHPTAKVRSARPVASNTSAGSAAPAAIPAPSVSNPAVEPVPILSQPDTPEIKPRTPSTAIEHDTGPGNDDPTPATVPAEDTARVFNSGATTGATAPERAYAPADYAHNPAPEYPERARREGWQGSVLLEVLITPDGKPARVEVRQSSGFEILDQAAMRAVKGWQFHPARYGATALEGWVKVPIVFRLNEKK